MLFTRGILPSIIARVCEYLVIYFTKGVEFFSRNINIQIQEKFGDHISAIISGNSENILLVMV
jgi:hypothetical protein